MKKSILWVCLMLLISIAPALAQQGNTIRIRGTVTDETTGQPVISATVHIEGSQKVTYTNSEGHYEIDAPQDASLNFSFLGYEKQTVPIRNRQRIDILLKESGTTKMAEMIVVGYSKVERRDLTGSVSTVKMPEQKPFLSFDQMLAGQAPGVYVSSSSGALGSANLLTIRGISSIMGDNNPLYVIDGVPMYGTDRSANSSSTTGGSFQGVSLGGTQLGGGSLNYNTEVMQGMFEKNPLASINPEDIESIEILKDAFSTAIYGSRGSAGVILITTKKGSREKTQVNVNYNLALDRPLGKLDLLNGDEYSLVYSDYYKGQNFPSGYNTDWLDAVTRTAVSHNLSASISGGTEKTNYFVSMSYNNNESYVINNDLTRYSARTNLDTRLNDHWNMGLNFTISQVNNKGVSASNIYGSALVKAPNLPIYDENGNYHYGYLPNSKGDNGAYNPVAMAYINDEYIRDTRVVGNAYLEFKPWTWLTLRSELGTDISNSLSSIRKGELPDELSEIPNNQAQESTSQNYKVVVNNTINFTKTLKGDHFLQGVIGQSYEYSNEYANSVVGRNFFSSELVGVGAAQTKTVSSAGRQEWALFSAFARLNYQYLHRYMAGVTYRIDGSSRFNKDHRYLGTPSLSLGWRISEEKFIRDNASWIDELKLRASVGWSSKDGNSSYYGAQAVYKLNTLNYGGQNFLDMSQPGNTELDWEKTITYDVGLDFTFLNRRIDATIDYFYKKTTNMLFSSNLPLYTGYSKQQQNIADMMNQGIEVKIISDNIRSRDFNWQTILNFSHSDNKILKLNFNGSQLEDLNSSTKYYAEGKPVAQFYLHEWMGVDPATGDPLWRYADGTISTTPPGSDYATSTANRKVSGTAMPTVYGGITNNLTYKDWELGFLFTFSCGGKLMNSTRAQLLTYSTEDANNLGKEIMRMWQVPGQETDIPRLHNASIINNYDYAAGIGSTRFLEGNSYLRLKNIELAYNLPKKWLAKTHFFNQFRIYALMTNVFTITGYSGLDPEVSAFGSSVTNAGYDNLTMPQSRSYQFGIRVGF